LRDRNGLLNFPTVFQNVVEPRTSVKA